MYTGGQDLDLRSAVCIMEAESKGEETDDP